MALRITFALQGEGRGHMTQALALAHHLRAAGHSVDQVWVGLGPGWSIPEFFVRGIGAPITTFRAPTHSLTSDRTRVNAGATFRDALFGLPAFLGAARARKRLITAANTDVVVGFYDAVGGIARMLGHSVPNVAIGHHYVLFHPDAPQLPLSGAAKAGLRWLTRVTAHRATEVLALSFADLDGNGVGVDPASRHPTIVPPILRPEVSELLTRDDGHLLAYAVTPGVGEQVVAWQKTRPEVVVHIYLAGGTAAISAEIGAGCHVHALDDKAFLAHMASCRAYAGSAGFESLCEAYYLGKPTLAVPTAGQVEQQLNAADGERTGVVRKGSWSDLNVFWDGATAPDSGQVAAFRTWVDSGPQAIVSRVVAAARSGSRSAAASSDSTGMA